MSDLSSGMIKGPVTAGINPAHGNNLSSTKSYQINDKMRAFDIDGRKYSINFTFASGQISGLKGNNRLPPGSFIELTVDLGNNRKLSIRVDDRYNGTIDQLLDGIENHIRENTAGFFPTTSASILSALTNKGIHSGITIAAPRG